MNAFTEEKKSAADIRVLQISDMHLFADSSGLLVGINTEDSFLAVLELAQHHSWPPDFIFLTGDISQDSSLTAYQRLIEHLKPLGIPCYILPGNHDKPERLQQIFQQPPFSYQLFLHHKNWLFAFLNSATPNEEGGTLDEEEIELLQLEMNKHPNKKVLICLHHQLKPVSSQWLDTMSVINPSSLIDIISNTDKVKGVIHGHVHQESLRNIKKTPIYGTPSTCFQFKPLSADFAIDNTTPGYRWLELSDNGEINTNVVRLKDMPGNLDENSNGY